jgi:hypothetical protein
MAALSERRGSCLIEAAARDLDRGGHWQPWLRLTRCVGGVWLDQTFDTLKPVFASEQAALRYASELGRRLADEGPAFSPESRTPGAATPALSHALVRDCDPAWKVSRATVSVGWPVWSLLRCLFPAGKQAE